VVHINDMLAAKAELNFWGAQDGDINGTRWGQITRLTFSVVHTFGSK
jgi:hypothetical protein